MRFDCSIAAGHTVCVRIAVGISIFVAVILGLPSKLSAASLTLTQVIDTGGQSNLLFGINNAGQAVGFVLNPFSHGLIDSGGTLIPFDVPGAFETRIYDIN